MKKLLGLLGALGMVASTGVSVVACGKKTESIGKVSLEKSTLSAKDDSTNLTVELNKDLASADKITVTSNKGENSLLNIEETKKETKKVVYKVSLKDDLPENEVSEGLTVKLNDTEVGSVEIKISKNKDASRTDVSLNLIQAVIGSGIGVNSNIIKNQEKVKDTLINFAKGLLSQYGFAIDVDVLLSMVNVKFLKNDTDLAINNQDKVAFVNLEIIEGKEDTIDGYHITGSAKIKIFEQNKLEEALKVRELGQLKIDKGNPDEYVIRQAILEKNSTTGFNSGNIYDIDIKNISINETKGTAQIDAILGKSFYSETSIEVSFTISEVEELNIENIFVEQLSDLESYKNQAQILEKIKVESEAKVKKAGLDYEIFKTKITEVFNFEYITDDGKQAKDGVDDVFSVDVTIKSGKEMTLGKKLTGDFSILLGDF